MLVLPNEGVELPNDGVDAAGGLDDPNAGVGLAALLPKAKGLFSVVLELPPKLKAGAGVELGAPLPKLKALAVGCEDVPEKSKAPVEGLATPPKLNPVEGAGCDAPNAAGDAELCPNENGAGAGVLEAPNVGAGAVGVPKLGVELAPKVGAAVLLEPKEGAAEFAVEPKEKPVEGASENI